MNFTFTAEEQAFAEEIRQFLKDEPPEAFPCEDEDEGYGFGGWSFAYNKRLGDKGWINRTWPQDCFGQGRPLMELVILFRELACCNAPGEALFYTETVATGLINHGSDELKRELLPASATGEATFWEGFSEPQSGSDLFSLRTTAVEDGDDYIINGQKVWNSNAHIARYGYTAARTDPNAPGHRGISLFIIDMQSPGITANPLDDMAGGQTFSEIFFDDVRVPKRNLIGEKNQGLPLIMHGLEWDRFWGRCVRGPFCRHMLQHLVEYCKEIKYKHGTLAEDPGTRYKLAQMAIEAEVCDMLFAQAAWMLNKGISLTHQASIGKTFADELSQRFSNTIMQIFGLFGQLRKDSKWARLNGKIARDYLCSPGHTLAGGTSEIQRNTIATRGLGLPRS